MLLWPYLSVGGCDRGVIEPSLVEVVPDGRGHITRFSSVLWEEKSESEREGRVGEGEGEGGGGEGEEGVRGSGEGGY